MKEHRAGLDGTLSAFTEELFAQLPRADQRRWARSYLQGLLATPGKKSVRRLAASVSSSPTASQSLQQFVNASPWDWEPTRRQLIRVAERHGWARAWVIETAVLPKRGDHSCGVHRRFVPSVGRTVNCQLGIGAFLSSESGDLPVDWRLLLPEQWGDDTRLCERARVPESARSLPLWAHVIDLVENLAAHTSFPAVPVVTDVSDYPEGVCLLDQLSRLGRDFVVSVPLDLPVLPAHSRPSGARRDATDAQGALDVRRFLQWHGTRHPYAVTFTTPGRQQQQVRVVSGLVRLPGSRHTYRVFAEQPSEGDRPLRVWITSLVDRDIEHLTALARMHSGTVSTLRSLEADYGLLDFEGRSFPGWHHHMTLVSAAYAYSRLFSTPGQSPQLDVYRRTSDLYHV
ncbi:IS701 family transposase [Streptomyces rectiviolaceus]|uniref:Transposase IS701-like DDE domain-containing protein n=1 Tax=Streptomyces rectiviolaceus TaxID=332591 RepID=A0ABP6MI77_9ACTN